MFTLKSINKTIIISGIATLLALTGSQAFADGHANKATGHLQDAQDAIEKAEGLALEPIVYTDPDTGEVIEITKLPSDMTDEEMAAYSVEDLDRLKSIEEMIKAQVEEKIKGQIPTIN